MGITWGIIAVIAVTFSLAAAVIIGLAIHSGKIRESEVKFRTLFQNVFDALFLIDNRGRIIDVNASACKISGYSKKELRRMSIDRLIPSEMSAIIKGKNAKMELGELIYFGETNFKNKNRDIIYVEVGGIRTLINKEEYTLASFRDINARKLAEIELEKKNIALQEILTHLEEEKKHYRNEIVKIVTDSLLPSLRKLINDNALANDTYYNIMEENLQKLALSTGEDIKLLSRLSPREIEICNLIRDGASSKEIAKTLNISLITVSKHRERIRKKLFISNKNISLSTFLNKS
ncbi:MAG: PAS domain S-box protein [Candidatus Zixiibacteriota bacterium]|nr:MAG: PAS domain S-box protein [candidate division Zixibacteria bacterium]